MQQVALSARATGYSWIRAAPGAAALLYPALLAATYRSAAWSHASGTVGSAVALAVSLALTFTAPAIALALAVMMNSQDVALTRRRTRQVNQGLKAPSNLTVTVEVCHADKS